MTDHDYKPDDDGSLQKETNDPATHPTGEVFHTEFGERNTPSEAIIKAVAAVEGVEPTEIEFLYERIDPDALDALFDGPVVGDGGTVGVEFGYSGHRVSVQNNGSITILENAE